MGSRPRALNLPRRVRLTAVVMAAGAALLLGACSGSGEAAPTATPPPVITPPAELAVTRGPAACYVRQHPAGDIPAVKGYRLVAASPLPDGIVPSVKVVRFVGSGGTRVLEAEICFTAEAAAPTGRLEAQLELRLYNADAEKLSFNDRLQPVRILRFSQVLQVR
jgi:hypothetical protein